MTDSFESILDESISALQAGVSIEEILAEVPEYSAELRPLLYAASLLADPNPKLIPAETKAALRADYMAQLADLPAIPVPTLGEKSQAIFRIVRRRLTREAVLNDLITVTITAILTLLMAALILNYTARDTIPGDFLYSVKRLSENTQLALTFNPEQQVELAEKFNQRRLSEIDQLIQANRAAVVQFQGILETKGENLWIIEGHAVFLPDDVIIDQTPQEGDRIEVIGLLRTNNVMVADTIRLVGP